MEIGTGTGRSTAAIARTARSVVSIEENSACLREAEAHLSGLAEPVKVVFREVLSPAREGYYQLGYKKIEETPPEDGILLLEGDFAPDPDNAGRCTDRNLERWLEASGSFDAIACWLIGSHSHRHANLAVSKRRISSSAEYRLFVQNYLYEFADKHLRAGGMLHIVDRGLAFSSNPLLLPDALQGHIAQASVTSLQVDGDFIQRPYLEVEGGIQMVWAPPMMPFREKDRPPPSPNVQKCFTSIKVVKPS